jgi:hypothetical protein
MRRRMTPVVLWAIPLLGIIATRSGLGGEEKPPLPDNRLGVRVAPLLLLSRPDVRADLRLDARQAVSAEQAITDLYVRASALRGKPNDRAHEEQRRAIDEAQKAWLEKELSREQRERLGQIDLQWEGPSALLSRPIVAEAIGLSDDQRAALSGAIELRRRERAQGKDRPEDERGLATKALNILTPDQRERWGAMLGPPAFTLQAAQKPGTAARK